MNPSSSSHFAPPYRLTSEALLRAVGGRALTGFVPGSWSITTDSRLAEAGRLFLALQGERMDGHRFVQDVLRIPGTAALVQEGRFTEGDLPPGRLVVEVEDTGQALLDLGRTARIGFSEPVIGLTGSVGKTTTKEMIAAILGERGPGLATEGNLNNLVGCPLTLLRLSPEHRFAVIEMGMNAFHEIEAMALATLPDVRLITRIGKAHLEKLGGVEGVARAKGELFATARPGDVLVINRDDPHSALLPLPEGCKVLGFGEGVGADVRLIAVRSEGWRGSRMVVDLGEETVDVALPLPGVHNVWNALSAVAVAVAVGYSGREIRAGLSRVKGPAMRMEVTELPSGALLINDAYNANETSMEAALSALAQDPSRPRIAVLGDMLELGEESVPSHREVGRLASGASLDLLVCLGEQSREILAGAGEAGMEEARRVQARSHAEAAAAVVPLLKSPGARVLVKGSRGMAMEKVIASWTSPEGWEGKP